MRGALDGDAPDYLIKPFAFRSFDRNCKPSGNGRTRSNPLRAPTTLVDSLFGCPNTGPRRPVLPKGLGEETG